MHQHLAGTQTRHAFIPHRQGRKHCCLFLMFLIAHKAEGAARKEPALTLHCFNSAAREPSHCPETMNCQEPNYSQKISSTAETLKKCIILSVSNAREQAGEGQ